MVELAANHGTKHEIESKTINVSDTLKPISHFDMHLLKEAMKIRIV